MSIGLLALVAFAGGNQGTTTEPQDHSDSLVSVAANPLVRFVEPMFLSWRFDEFTLPVSQPQASHVTHYGEQYNGRPLSCGTGMYSSSNPEIVAVGPDRYRQWPCGTQLRICGPAGCINAQRHDSCPGCSANVFDLSESGIAMVCGAYASTCRASVGVVDTLTLPVGLKNTFPEPGPLDEDP